MKRFVIVKTGDTLPELRKQRGDFEAWIAAGMGLELEELLVCDVARGAVLPDPRVPLGIVVTGSSAMVTEHETWSERSAAWLADACRHGTPMLGICYGHQLLAYALGGRVDQNPRGRQIGTVPVTLRGDAKNDPLLGSLPPEALFHATHVQSVLELPPGARWLASSAGDPHHAFALGTAAWGVQFHPEFDAEIIENYLETRRAIIEREGIDVDAKLALVRQAPEGARLLRRFRWLAEHMREPCAAGVEKA